MSTLALTSNTLAVTAGAGQLEYDGQFFATDSNASRGQLQRITQGTAVASTSGTSIDFTGIPAWAKKITVMFSGVSTNGTSILQVQLGAGSVTTSGYLSSSSNLSTVTSSGNSTSGFQIGLFNGATNVRHGSMILNNITGNIWGCFGVIGLSNAAATATTAGSITISGALDRVRVTTVNGTDTFDAGSINIMYEG